MAIKNKAKILEGAKQAFFKAMLAGYFTGGKNSGATETKSPDGSTTIRFSVGLYVVIDSYDTSEHSNSSAGTTRILYRGRVIWRMSYSGYYEERAVSHFKMAIQMAYLEGSFFGGRGIPECKSSDNTLLYENMSLGDFESFSGREQVTNRRTGNLLGYHQYFGISLI